MSNIQEKIQEELQHAREVCQTDGAKPGECAAAWDAAEEVLAEAAHERQAQPVKSSFEKYCDENPGASECRIFDE